MFIVVLHHNTTSSKVHEKLCIATCNIINNKVFRLLELSRCATMTLLPASLTDSDVGHRTLTVVESEDKFCDVGVDDSGELVVVLPSHYRHLREDDGHNNRKVSQE